MQSVLNFFTGIWLSVVNAMVGWSPASRNKAAHLLAWLFWHVVPKRRKVALTNLKLCFPNWTESKRQEIAKQCFYRLARAALDHSVLWKGSAEQVRNFVRFDEGVVERITSTENRPLIVIAPHFAGLDASGIGLNLFVRGVSLYQRQSNPVWDEALLKGRLRFSNPVLIPKSNGSDLRPVMRAMREGLPFYYLPDMDHGRRNSVFVPFFGVQAATIPMVSRLAKVMKAKVLWSFAVMTEDGYEVEITPPLENFPTNDPEADTKRLNEELEARIRQHPDQYLWVHRRFKTRPEGEPSVY